MAGLNNKILQDCGTEIRFYPGLPEFFDRPRPGSPDKPEYRKHDIQLEHYIVSTGLAQMIRGSAIAPHVDGIWGCEFIENPLQPGFLQQKELELSAEAEIAQIGMVIDNTTKTRALFEINKGTNKNPAIDVNSTGQAGGPADPVPEHDLHRRRPERRAELLGRQGQRRATRTRVYNPGQAGGVRAERPPAPGRPDRPLRARRLHRGEQHHAIGSSLQIHEICDRIVADREAAVAPEAARPPRHLNPTPGEEDARRAPRAPEQSKFLE